MQKDAHWLLEELATIDESDEDFMTKVLENPEIITEEEINAAIRKGVIANLRSIPSFAEPPLKTKGFNSFSMRLYAGCPLPSTAEPSKGSIIIQVRR